MSTCTCYDTLVVKDLNRWFKEKWVDVSRKDKDGKHPPCGRSKAKKGSKGYPKCRPSVKVSSKTPKTSGSMSEGQKRAATERKRSKKQGVGGKPTIVKQVAVEPELSMVDFSTEEHPFMPPMYPCEHRLSGCQGVTEVSGPSDLRYPNDNWITACRPCYDKITRGYDGGLSEPMIATGEPMDIAFQLLKMPLLPESVKRVSDNRTEAQFQDPKTNQVYPMVAEKDPKFRTMNVGIYPNQPEQNLGAPTALDAMDLTDKDIDDDIKEQLNLGLSNAELTETNEDNPYYESDMTWTDPEKRRRGYASALYDLVNQLGEQKVRPSDNQSYEGKQLWSKRMLPKGEPMDITFQLLKNPVSPEAKRHKLEYDKQYESNPKRVKYREELNRERRKRGIYGHGGPDMSHTKDHTLVAESPHANRARHFKERGTLKSEVVLVKVRL